MILNEIQGGLTGIGLGIIIVGILQTIKSIFSGYDFMVKSIVVNLSIISLGIIAVSFARFFCV